MINFPRYTQITSKDILLSFFGRVLGVLAKILPYIWFYFMNGVNSGNECFAIIGALLLTAAKVIAVYLVLKTLYKLANCYIKYTGIRRIMACLFAFIIPCLEIRYLFKDKNNDIVVPAFIQKIKDMNVIFCSFFCFIYGLPNININALAEELKKLGFFSMVRNEYDSAISISTNLGIFCLLQENSRVYMFKELEDGESYTIPANSDWIVEASSDCSSSAILLDYAYNPFVETEKTLANTIAKHLQELKEFYNGI